jgi:hypothetical protein
VLGPALAAAATAALFLAVDVVAISEDVASPDHIAGVTSYRCAAELTSCRPTSSTRLIRA